jgi:hypothetical protein
VATAYFEGGLLVQLREPDLVRIVKSDGTSHDIDLGGEELSDFGYRLFHRGNNGFTAVTCASCHPEGRDDGHVWQFTTLGARRTQSLVGGISDTAPFHWSGDMPDLGSLMDEVFVRRMGQEPVSADGLQALAAWLDAQPAIPSRPERDLDPAGRAAFEKAGCDTCHTGDTFRSTSSHDVGTGGPFQVPSLLGVATRAPFMHNGCAPTLEARLDDPACGGGASHGDAALLDDVERAALLSYLRTL